MGLRPAAVFVCPGQEIDSAGFADCFTVEAALSLNVCLFYSMTLLGKLLPMVVVVVGGAFVGWGGGGLGAQTRNTCTRRQATALLFALAEETLRGVEFFFFLHSPSKPKSITAKIRTIILQPGRKYYFPGWLVLSLIFLSTHHYRDIEALGTRASRCLPLWWKRISRLICSKGYLDGVMFLYNMHCQAKTGKAFLPKNSFQPLLFITSTTTDCTYVTIILFSGSKTQLQSVLFWSEMKAELLGYSEKPLGFSCTTV